MTFNNATIHADMLKAAVSLAQTVCCNIGGGTLSADTHLKLYANSSNGTVNFIANVTLTGASGKIIAGDTVKVFDSVVVTIGMSPADIYDQSRTLFVVERGRRHNHWHLYSIWFYRTGGHHSHLRRHRRSMIFLLLGPYHTNGTSSTKVSTRLCQPRAARRRAQRLAPQPCPPRTSPAGRRPAA